VKLNDEEGEDTQVLNDQEVLSGSPVNHRESEKSVSFIKYGSVTLNSKEDDGVEVPKDGTPAQRSRASSAPGEDGQVDVSSFIDLILDGAMTQVQGKGINL